MECDTAGGGAKWKLNANAMIYEVENERHQ